MWCCKKGEIFDTISSETSFSWNTLSTQQIYSQHYRYTCIGRHIGFYQFSCWKHFQHCHYLLEPTPWRKVIWVTPQILMPKTGPIATLQPDNTKVWQPCWPNTHQWLKLVELPSCQQCWFLLPWQPPPWTYACFKQQRTSNLQEHCRPIDNPRYPCFTPKGLITTHVGWSGCQN